MEINADHGGTAIGHVENLNLFLQAAATQKASTAVLPIASMQSQGPPFVGRLARLKELAEFLDPKAERKSVAVVTGPPGVGKTALVREAAKRSIPHNRFCRALFADLRGYEEVTADRVQPAEMYSPLLRGLGVPDAQIPETLGDQATLYHRVLDAMARAGNPALIWLDNVSDRGQVEALMPGNRLHRVVVTTRETFPGDPNRDVIDLEVLSIEEAVELLATSVQDRAEDSRFDSDPEASRELAELCDRLPLALQIVAALLADEPLRALREFVSELEEEENRLDNLHYDDRLSVRAALTLSYKRLSDDLQRLFRLMSQVPGGDVSLDAGRWLIDASAAAVRPQLMALVRSHLVQQHVSNRWSMHDLIRLYSAELAAADPADADRALKSVVEHYRAGVSVAFEWLTAVASVVSQKVFSSPAAAAAWFEVERPTAMSIVMQIAGREGYEEICLAFGVVLGDLLKAQAHWRTDFYDVAAVAASLVPRVDNQKLAASALNNYGTALRFQGNSEGALAVLDQAVQRYEDIGDADGPAGHVATSPTFFRDKAVTTRRSSSTGRTSSSARHPRTPKKLLSR